MQKVREFRNWYEPWEMMVFKKDGNQYHKQLVEMKYGALSFKRQDNGEIGFTLKEGCAVKIRCSADKRYGTELQAVDGCCWFYGVLICYDGFDVELPYDTQNKELYDIMELMHSDFYQGVESYYAENCDPTIKIIKKGEMPSWKLPAEHDYARRGGVYVGGEHESDVNDSDSDEENEFEG